ncbi:MAG TPA: hypothetical protein VGD76_18875 [Ramlibacter sp.]
MPDMQPSTPSAAMPVVMDPAVPDDLDYALGCECADPSLQIERWAQEARGGDAN